MPCVWLIAAHLWHGLLDNCLALPQSGFRPRCCARTRGAWRNIPDKLRAETRRNVKGKAPAVAARRRILVAECERGHSREIKHIGDRFRKPQRKSARASNDVGTGTSKAATCSCSTRTVQGDDVVFIYPSPTNPFLLSLMSHIFLTRVVTSATVHHILCLVSCCTFFFRLRYPLLFIDFWSHW